MEDHSYYGDAQGRYMRDPNFRSLVDMMHIVIRKGEFTPSELRDAAILAATHYEIHSKRAREYIFSKEDMPLFAKGEK